MNINDLIEPTPLANHHPASWKPLIGDAVILDFRNREHFKNTVSTITQINDNKCDITYANALTELKQGKGAINPADYQHVKHKVKEALLKRNLISDNIYQGFEYSVQGELIDVARYAAGNPECAIIPKSVGKNYFYELYINASIPWQVSDKDINDKLARILATIELLESERIFIKVNAVVTAFNLSRSTTDDLAIILPVFSHRDFKSIDSLSSIINVRYLRKFGFAIFEHLYGDDLEGGYGTPKQLPNCINLMDDLDECELAESILDQFVTPGKRK